MTGPSFENGRLPRAAIALIVAGFFIFVIGIFPDIVRLNLTPGFGLIQIFAFLFGIGLMTLGGYVYAYATRLRARERRLRHDIGVRLIASGYVLCCVSALADILGIGSHNIPDSLPVFGLWQSTGVLAGVLVIVFGLFLYVMKVEE
jgi:MFS family permease